MNMNYHAVHHLWPSIPYHQLPAADRTIRERAGAAGLEWRRSYLGYFVRYALALPLEDCRKA
jgi:fatty acid desaturase